MKIPVVLIDGAGRRLHTEAELGFLAIAVPVGRIGVMWFVKTEEKTTLEGYPIFRQIYRQPVPPPALIATQETH